VDLLWTCTVRLFDRPARVLTNISTILATRDDNFDVLAACCTINVASAEVMLYLHIAASQQLCAYPSACLSLKTNSWIIITLSKKYII